MRSERPSIDASVELYPFRDVPMDLALSFSVFLIYIFHIIFENKK